MKEKKNRGITLIALVITIIVLLILAGVTLSTLFGNNGILTESRLAVESNKEANAREQVQLAWIGVETEYQAALTKDSTKTRGDYFNNTNLNKNLGAGNINLTQFEENGKSIVEYVDESNTKYTYEIVNGQVYSDGTAPEVVDPGSLAGTLTKTVEAKNYGDFINYNVDLNGDGNTTNDWKIFYNDGENVFIIASDCIANSKIPSSITTIEKYNSYSMYWKNTIESNAGASQIDTETAKKFELNWLFEGNHASSSNSNMKAVRDLMDTNKWSSFATGVSGAEAIGSPTLEMWINSWNQKHPSEVLRFYSGGERNSDGSVYNYAGVDYNHYSSDYGYYVGAVHTNEEFKGTLTDMVTYLPLNSDGSADLYPEVKYTEGMSDSLYAINKRYWFASPSASTFQDQEKTNDEWIGGKNVMIFGKTNLGSCVITSDYVPSWNDDNPKSFIGDTGLRPVVCLPSNVNASKSGAIWNIE